jgi:hypothetical protein
VRGEERQQGSVWESGGGSVSEKKRSWHSCRSQSFLSASPACWVGGVRRLGRADWSGEGGGGGATVFSEGEKLPRSQASVTGNGVGRLKEGNDRTALPPE